MGATTPVFPLLWGNKGAGENRAINARQCIPYGFGKASSHSAPKDINQLFLNNLFCCF